MIRSLLWVCIVFASVALGEPLAVRIMAANLTSESHQAYSPDNGTHSNPEGAGARIIKALKPDVVLIQEFNTTVPVRQWVNRTLGEGFKFFKEPGMQIPNGIISRYPIAESGVWNDPVLNNREFVWARLRLPGERDLWVVSVHFRSKSATSRQKQALALSEFIRAKVPAGAMLVVGGDLNTRRPDEACFGKLAGVVVIPGEFPADGNGNIASNAPRNRPYDHVLASKALQTHSIPVVVAGLKFPHGMVFDSRVFPELGKCPPVQVGDSGVPYMQHMAVVRDFRIP